MSEETVDGWEGCLSLPGLRGKVPRFSHIQYSGFDQYGQPIKREVTGFHARVVQPPFGFSSETFPDSKYA